MLEQLLYLGTQLSGNVCTKESLGYVIFSLRILIRNYCLVYEGRSALELFLLPLDINSTVPLSPLRARGGQYPIILPSERCITLN